MEDNGKEGYIKILEDFIQKLRSDEVTDFEIECSNPPQMMFSHEHRDFIRVPSENHSIEIRYILKKKENKKCYWCPSCGNKLNESMFCSFCCSTWATLPILEEQEESNKNFIAWATSEGKDVFSHFDNMIKSKEPKKDANYFIDQAKKHMSDRASSYDNEGGERSMLSTVRAFSDITGICMTEEHGWLFMGVLKMVRSQQGKFKSDNYEDGCAYFGLAGEAAAKNRQ